MSEPWKRCGDGLDFDTRWSEGGLGTMWNPAPETLDLSNAATDGDRPASENEEEALVGPDEVCPDCHEARMDYLIWDENGEIVTCATCGCVYVP